MVKNKRALEPDKAVMGSDGRPKYLAKDFIRDEDGIGIQYQDFGTWINPHTHDFIEFVYIVSGNATHTVGEQSFNVTKGDFLLVDKNTAHSFSMSEGSVYYNIYLLPEFISNKLTNSSNILDVFSLFLFGDMRSGEKATQDDGASIPISTLARFRGTEMYSIEAILASMLKELDERRPEYIKIVSSYVNVLFMMLIRNMQENKTRSLFRDIRDSMPEIVDYINRNTANKITLDEIATKYFYSPAYFSRMFKQCFGIKFTQYIQNKRIENAVALLTGTAMSIEEISAAVGYGDKRDFYRTFRKVMGTTPSDFRSGK